MTPADRLAGRQAAISAQRDQKLAAARERRAARRNEHAQRIACENGTQRKASGVQWAAMGPLVARADDNPSNTRPAEGETNPATNILNPLTVHLGNSISR